MNIALIDSSTDLDLFSKQQEDYSLIIAFDYDSHYFLSSNNISHRISDEFTTDDELKKLQQKSYHYSKWFEMNDVSKFITFKEINLGELFFTEFHYFLVPILKKFFEIQKIFSEFPKANFSGSGIIFKILQEFSKNISLLTQKNEEKKIFLNDSIKKTFKLGNKEISLSFSRSKFKKIKKQSELLFDKFFHPKENISYDVMLVEFDPIKYEKLFNSMPKLDVQGLYLGLRRPAIWNKKSLSIFKKSKCDLVPSYVISDEQKKIIEEEKIITAKFFISFKDLENKFFDFFSLEQNSFWNVIKIDFLELCKKRMNEFVSDVVIIHDTLTKLKIKNVLVWSEQSSTEIITLKLSKKYNIPVLLLQHGYYHDTEESFEYLDFMGNIPNYSTKAVVWGEIFEQYLTSMEIKSKIISIGNPFYDNLIEKNKESKNSNFILLATSGPVDNIMQDLKINTREKYVESIITICNLIKNSDKHMKIKLHPWQEEFFPAQIFEDIDSKIEIVKEGNIQDLIQNCEIFITFDISTTILEAFFLEKPTISLSVKNYGWGEASIFKTGSCISTESSDFSQILETFLSNPEFRQNLTNKGKLFLEKYLANKEKSSELLLQTLKENQNS